MSGLITAVVVATVATTASVVESRKARKAQKKAGEIAAKSQKLEAARNSVEQVRQAQIARASVLQSGENQGVLNSTAVTGGVGSIQSQAGGNLGFAQQIFGMQQSRNRLLQSAATHQGRAGDFGAVASLAMMAGGVSGGGGGGGGGGTSSGTTTGAGNGTVMNNSFQGIGS